MPDPTEDLRAELDLGDLDELAFAKDVLRVYEYLNRPRIPATKGKAVQALHQWATDETEGSKNKLEFLKFMLPKAQEAVRKAKLGQTTEAEILHERKALAELQVVLRDMIEEKSECSTG